MTLSVGFEEPEVVAISYTIEPKGAASLPIPFDGRIIEECRVDDEAVSIDDNQFEAIIKI